MKSIKPLLISLTVLLVTVCFTQQANALKRPLDVPAEMSFDQTDGVLAKSRVVEDIEYKIMVQRATQAATYYMPAVVMVNFIQGSLPQEANALIDTKM